MIVPSSAAERPAGRARAPMGGALAPWAGAVLRWALVIAALVCLGMWVRQLWSMYAEFGLFLGVGYDYGTYYAQSVAVAAGQAATMYEPQTLARFHDPLVEFVRQPRVGLPVGAVPYPPLFAWLLTPFTWPSPPVGFVAWTVLNLVALVHLARRAAQLFPRTRLLVFLMVVISPGVMGSIYLGQPMILLGSAFAEFYLSLRAGQEFRAGLWLACFLLKPHYAVLLGVILLWKRQWGVLGGAAVGSAVVAIGSVLLVGVPAAVAYVTTLGGITKFGADPVVFGATMINWRGLALELAPFIGDRRATALYIGLSLLTIAVVALASRGPWLPRDRRFPATISLILIGTILTTFHSHTYGLTLLVVPLASLMAEGSIRWSSRAVVLVGLAFCLFGGIIGTGLALVIDPNLLWSAQRIALATLAAAGCALLVDRWRDRRADRAATAAGLGSAQTGAPEAVVASIDDPARPEPGWNPSAWSTR